MEASYSVLKLLLISAILTATFNNMLAFGFVGPEERKCNYGRVDKLYRVRCYDMNLKEVPSVRSSVEVMDLSFNRIRKLHKTSFQPYGSIKFLLLYENMIQFIEPGTFSQLTSLQEIDLSNNALTSIPFEIFQLPSLRNLYVDSNDLIFLEDDLEHLDTPIDAPLEYLNVANCGLRNLPNLGILPKLWHINASRNPLTDLTMDRFAYMCHLKDIDLTATLLTGCLCQQVNNHLRHLGAKTKFVPVCVETLDLKICPLPHNDTVLSETFESCRMSIQRAEARSMWLFVSGILGGILAVILLTIYCFYRRRRKTRAKKLRRSSMRSKSLVISPKNAINVKRSFMPANHKQETGSHEDLAAKYGLNDDLHQDKELLNCDNL